MPSGLLIGGAALASGALGYFGAKSAASTQANSAAQALALQQQEFGAGQQAVTPFVQAGQGASNQLANIYGIPYSNAAGSSAGGQTAINNSLANFTNTPDYSFAFSQGQRAADAASAAAGQNPSSTGAGIKNDITFGQGLATQQFGNYFNRLLQLSQLGGQSANSLLSGSLQAGQTQGNTVQAQGQAQASGTVGGINALTGSVGSGISNYLLASKLNNNNSSTTTNNPSSYGSISIPGFNPVANAATPGG